MFPRNEPQHFGRIVRVQDHPLRIHAEMVVTLQFVDGTEKAYRRREVERALPGDDLAFDLEMLKREREALSR